MKSVTRAASVVGAAVACVALGAGTASAVSTDSYASVRQVLCSTTNAAVDISYTNSYGNTTRRENVALRGQKLAGNKSCIRADLTTGEYGEYIGTSISADDGGYVYCAVYVNGRKVAESVDDSSYYSYAIC